MGTREIRVSDDLYARVKRENREGESLGETLERLVDDYSLLDFADDAAELELDGSVAEAVDGAVEAPTPESRRPAAILSRGTRRRRGQLSSRRE